VRSTIRPALERGEWVISDRFADSTRVYQGVLGNVEAFLIRRLERITLDDTRPDLTLIFDLPAEVGLERAARRRGSGEGDRFEAETLDFHKRLREAYLELADREPDRCAVIDASHDAATVSEVVWVLVRSRLNPPEAPSVQLAQAAAP
jgi:dTMP kinase